MSAKAQILLGVMPETEQQRYRASARVSRRTSITHDPNEDYASTLSLRSATSFRPQEVSAERSTSSITSNKSRIYHDTGDVEALSDRPALSSRRSNSTIRSFAPPTVPTYLPRHMGSTFVPHIAYGRTTETEYAEPQHPFSRPKPLQYPVPHSPEQKHGLRKAISKISLRSKKSRSRLSEAHRPETSACHSPVPTAQPGTEPGFPASPSAHQAVETPRLKPKTPGFVNGTRPTQETEQQSVSRLARSRRETAVRSKEWFDALDTSEEDVVVDTLSPIDTASFGRVTRRKDALPRPLRDLETHLSPHTRIKRDSFATQPSYTRAPTTRTLKEPQGVERARVSVICEQTMFDFAESDSDSDESAERLPPDSIRSIAVHRRRRSSKGSGIFKTAKTLSATSRHKRQSSSKSVQRRMTALFDSSEDDEEFLRKLSLTRLEDTLTESIPSLIGSGSSRPTSLFSTHPSSPLARLSYADSKTFAPITIADEEQWLRAERIPSLDRSDISVAMVPDIKTQDSATCIVASLSPEEAILLAKIRRNRTNTSINPSAPTSEADPKPDEPDRSDAAGVAKSTADCTPNPEDCFSPPFGHASFFHPLARLAAEDSARLARRDSKLRAILSPPPRDPRRARVVSQSLSPPSIRFSVLSESEDSIGDFPTPPSSAPTSASLSSPRSGTALKMHA